MEHIGSIFEGLLDNPRIIHPNVAAAIRLRRAEIRAEEENECRERGICPGCGNSTSVDAPLECECG